MYHSTLGSRVIQKKKNLCNPHNLARMVRGSPSRNLLEGLVFNAAPGRGRVCSSWEGVRHTPEKNAFQSIVTVQGYLAHKKTPTPLGPP